MVKVLGLDIGESKTGVAIADTEAPVAIPRGIIKETGRDKLIDEIIKLIKNEKIEMIVAGIPYNLKGEIAFQAERTLAFIKHLKRAVDIPVETIDERLTNKASQTGSDDASAAAMILQTWLDRNSKKRESDDK